MGIQYYDLLVYAKAGRVQFCIRLEYDTESPEPLKSDDLSIFATKSDEMLQGDSLL